MAKGNLPIGYWLKKTDEVITQRVNQVQEERGFTRSRWQVLNMVYETAPISKEGIYSTLKTFISLEQLDGILAGFEQQGWLDHENDQLTLTDKGRVEREEVFAAQIQVRKQVLQGITEQEYLTVIDVLQRMVRNLEEYPVA